MVLYLTIISSFFVKTIMRPQEVQMKMKSRLTTLTLVALTASTLFLSSPKPAQAFFVWSPFEIMVESMLTLMNNSMDNMTTSMTTISTDIGTMADRILIMADNIGIMADRIVETEVLMTDLVRDVTDSQGQSTLLTLPIEGDLVALSYPMNISLSNGASDYVLFISNTADMELATNILVTGGDSSIATDRATAYATGEQLYLAVKAINNNTMGPISNTVMINLIP